MTVIELIKELLEMNKDNSYRNIDIKVYSIHLTSEIKLTLEEDEDHNLTLIIEGKE